MKHDRLVFIWFDIGCIGIDHLQVWTECWNPQVNELKKSSYQEEMEKQEKEQRLADYRRQLEEEKLLKEREKSDLIRELVRL